jgi:hypothetical protein
MRGAGPPRTLVAPAGDDLAVLGPMARDLALFDIDPVCELPTTTDGRRLQQPPIGRRSNMPPS